MNACTVDITKHLTENNISLESVSYIIASYSYTYDSMIVK